MVKLRLEKIARQARQAPKNYHLEFKAKVALEATRGKLTFNEVSKQFSVHPTQIAKWKKQLLGLK